MTLRKTFEDWASRAKDKYAPKQWLLSKWEVVEGIEWPEEKIRLMTENISASLGLKKKDSLIDLGCGGGWILSALGKTASEVYGLDFSMSMLACAAKTVGRGNFVCGEIGALPLKPETFSRALSYFVFMNFTDDAYIEKCLLEIFRILKKGGRALVGQLPYKESSSRYDAAKKEYLAYCLKKYKMGESNRDVSHPPIKLFDRDRISAFLKSQGIRHSFRDSFNPFYRLGEPVTVDWRFDLVLEKT